MKYISYVENTLNNIDLSKIDYELIRYDTGFGIHIAEDMGIEIPTVFMNSIVKIEPPKTKDFDLWSSNWDIAIKLVNKVVNKHNKGLKNE